MQIRMNAAKGIWLATKTMVFLILLHTQLFLERDAIDARCLSIERCWTERSSHRCCAVELRLQRLVADLAAAFIELCTAAGATLALIAAIALVSSWWDNFVWLPNCCSPLHWGQILDRIQLEGPKKCWRSAWICGYAITVQAFPVVWLLRGHLVEKNEIFSTFQILFKQTSNASECVL